MELLELKIFEKERDGRTEVIELTKEEFRDRFKHFNSLLLRLELSKMVLELCYTPVSYPESILNWLEKERWREERKTIILGTRLSMDNDFYSRIRPIIEDPIKKKLAHICSISDILED